MHGQAAIDVQQDLWTRNLLRARVQIMAHVYDGFCHARGVAAERRQTLLVPRTPAQSYDGIA